jgi:hypothetical protein
MKKILYTLLAALLLATLTLTVAAPAYAWWEANTVVGIQGPNEPVPECSTITLVITEYNNGDPAYYITDAWVDLQPVGYVLDKASGYYYGGDADSDGILDVGETWEWHVDVQVCVETTFVAIGHGYAQGNSLWDVTYPAFASEKAELTVYVTPPDGGEGFTPGYWKNHYEDWAATGYALGDDFDTIFGVDWYDPDIDLEAAIWMKGGGLKALTRHATAALLNAAHPGVEYDMTVAEVIEAVQNVTNVNALKNLFESYNEQGGDL